MSSYSLTRSRAFQYVGILLVLAAIAAGYWYFSVRAGVRTNSGAVQPGGGANLSAGLALYWPLDDGSGTNADDKSVNANDGTLTNGPTFTTGQIGGGVDFDGTNDSIAVADPASGVMDFQIPGDPWTTPGDIFTLAAWFNRDTATTDDTIIAKKNDQSTGDGYIVWIGGADDKIHARVQSTTNTPDNSEVTSTTTYTATGWHQLSVVVDEYVMGAGATGCPLIFVDGVDVTDGASCGSYLHYVDNTSNAVAFTVGAESDGGNPFDGKLDDIRVYNRPISLDEVGQLYLLGASTAGIDTSLRGYWSFDAPSISTTAGIGAYDWSGAGNWGELVNGPTATEGRVGQALQFDGTDDYVDMGDVDALDGLTTITAMAWIKTTASGERHFLDKSTCLGFTDGGAFEMMTGGFVANKASFVIIPSGGTPANYVNADSSVDVTDGVWHHVVGTYDGTTVRIYVDGVLSGTTALSATMPSTSALLQVGGDCNAHGGLNFDGAIDEPRVYNRTLSAAEIQSVYARSAPDKSNTSAGQKQGTGNLDSGLFAYFPLDENTGTSTADTSTNGNAGTLTNGPTWTTGRIGSAVNFDGTNDHILNASSAFVTALDQPHSFFAWVYPESYAASTFRSVVSFGEYNDSNWNTGLALYDSTGKVVWMVDGNDAPWVESGLTVPLNQWSFVGVMRNNVNETMFFVNGSTVTVSDSSVLSLDNDPVLIGATGHNGVLGGYFDGSIDEVRLYNRTVSPDEARRIYQLTTPTGVDTSLKGYWSFNGQDVNGTTAYDRSGAGNTGTLTNGPVVSEGRVGQSLSFDGTNDYVDIGNPTSLQITGSMTIGSWVKFQGTPGGNDYIVVSKSDGGNTDYGWMFAAASVDNGPIQSYFEIAVNASTTAQRYSAATLEPDTWYHLVGVYDASLQTLSMYVNGVLNNGLLDGTVPASQRNATIGATIGERPNSSGFLDGSLDELRIYNRILTAAEIAAQYAAGAPDKTNTSAGQAQGTGRLDSGLAGYWKLDENTGTSAADASSAGTTGTLTNGPTWATGRIGTGVDFDGTDDYISLGTPAALDFEGAHTVSAWVKTDVTNTDQTILALGTAGCCGAEINLDLDYNGGGGYYDFTFSHGGGGILEAHTSNIIDVQTGTWYHVVGTWDGVGTRRVYVNGVLRNSDTLSSLTEYADTVQIGDGQGAAPNWNGIIDEVRVYDRAISGDEVANLYRLTAPTGVDTSLRGYWSFNGQDMNGTTVYDRSGAGNNGTLTNGATITEGKLGQGVLLDGTNDYVTVPDSASLRFSNHTVMAWVKWNTLPTSGQWSQILGFSSGNNYNIYSLGYDNAISRGWNATIDPDWSNDYVSYPVTPSLGVWYHAVTTYDNTSGSYKLYLNGVLAAENTVTASPDLTAGGELRIGDDPTNGPNAVNGVVDEVRVYNRVLSGTEIKALYSSGR